jgi:MFS family permease
MAPPKPPPTAAWRWSALVALSVALFGNYYVYDSVAPVADALQRLLGFSDAQLGTLNAIYSLPNVLMVLVGGVVVDRFGTKTATLFFALLCLAGAALTAASPLFPVMAAGRLLFGLGAESMIVAVTVAIGQWFAGSHLGFAFGLNLSIARAGSYSADLSTSWFRPLYDAGWQGPLWLAVGFMAVSVGACVAFYWLERRAAQRFTLPSPEPTDRVVWRDLLRFDRSYWYIVGLCVTFYSVIFPFRSTFAIKYFQHAHGLTLQEAGALNGYVYLAAIFGTPVCGLLADRLGHRAALMALGSLLLAATFPVLAYTSWSLWIATVMIGIAFCLVPAVLWPAVPRLVEASRLGTAYGLMTLLQNAGMMLVNVWAGRLNDSAGAGAENRAGYTPMLWLFMGLALMGFVFSAALRRRESSPVGHGLERS